MIDNKLFFIGCAGLLLFLVVMACINPILIFFWAVYFNV